MHRENNIEDSKLITSATNMQTPKMPFPSSAYSVPFMLSALWQAFLKWSAQTFTAMKPSGLLNRSALASKRWMQYGMTS